MPVTYSDQEVERLLLERKPMPSDWSSRVRLRPKRGHQERDLTLSGDVGSEFRLILKREDAYAEPTGRYADFRGALRCLIGDTDLEIPPDPQGEFLFEER